MILPALELMTAFLLIALGFVLGYMAGYREATLVTRHVLDEWKDYINLTRPFVALLKKEADQRLAKDPANDH